MLFHFLITSTLGKNHAPYVLPKRQPEALETEKDIIDAVLAGNQQAFTLLFRRYEKMVFSIALSITRQNEDAEEVMQDTFLKACRYLPGWRADCSFKTWLFRIARTTSLDHLRRKRLDTVSLETPELAVWQLQEPAKNSLQNIMDDERVDRLKGAMKKLSAADEAALMLFYFHEQSIEEVSATMGWTSGNTKSRLCRARQRLKEVLVEDAGVWA